MAESQTIRFIEEIDGIDREAASKKITDCKAELRDARKNPRTRALPTRVSEIYQEMHDLQFCPEYLCLVCDSEKDYRRACEGFEVNGMSYRRLLGTSGGVKQSTIVFVSTHTRHGVPLIDALKDRINNDRDMTMTYIPAKLEAYLALTCSSSTPVEWPNGVAVVRDCMTKFYDDYVLLEDSPDGGEPVATDIKSGELEMDASDGYGLMLPSLAERWSRGLDLHYTSAGFCVRNAFCKGMVYAFDFRQFAEEVAGSYMIEDVWGYPVDVRDVELILTESMLKLWDAYASIDAYQAACEKNGYSFSVTKATPEELDTVRRLNYQFIQSYHLTDEDIWELIEPTVTELSDAMGGDVNRALLFLRGKDVTSHTVRLDPYDFVSALMIADEMIYDPYVCSRIKQLINKRVTEAKFGKIYVHGNYSIISGDPYALCQNMFGLEVTGLLSPGEIYNAYWKDAGVDEAVCFRAPMSSHRNIRRVKICRSDAAAKWYQYMNTVTILNAFDTMCMALNGADYDGDQVMITDNPVLLRKHIPLPAVNCVQKKGVKKIPTEADYIQANLNGFGDAIGTITNRITTQYDIQARFAVGSDEWDKLEYRIACGQKYQQENIDKIKGISAEPMPIYWYDRDAAGASADTLNIDIVADRKPYFMSYRYPSERSKYTKFIKAADQSALILFGKTVADLLKQTDYTDEEMGFIDNYYRRIPMIDNGGTMNRLCHAVEDYFEANKHKASRGVFDYTIMKSGVEYSKHDFKAVRDLYEEYQSLLKSLSQKSMQEYWTARRFLDAQAALTMTFREELDSIVPDPVEQCDILLDLCYNSSKGKNFVWDLCSEQIIRNLLSNRGGVFKYLERDPEGTVSYNGERFSVHYKEVMDEVSDHE